MEEEDKRKDFSIVLTLQEQSCAFRDLQGRSGRSLIDPTLQDNVIILDGFFKYIYHVGCAINLHSIINSGLILEEQKFEQQTDRFFFCLQILWTREHKDPDTIDLEAPRLAQNMHKAWKKLSNMVFWVETNLALKKGLKFYQTRSNTIILHESLTAYCIPKVVRMEIGEVIYEKVYASPRPLPKISLTHDWMSFSTSKKFPLKPTKSKPRSFAVIRINERSLSNEVDIDFRIPGLPQSVVKQADIYRVRELVKKSRPPSPTISSTRSSTKQCLQPIFKEMSNVVLFELFNTDPKTQCTECLLYWSLGIIHCTCGHLLKESEANRGAIQCTLNLLSIPIYVLKKGRPHGHRYGKYTEQRDCHDAHILRKNASRDPSSFCKRS